MDLRGVLLDPQEAALLDVRGGTTAAVLVALFERDGELHAVFTERRHDLRRHAGEISFPGGRQDATDRGLIETALREAHEEIGLDPKRVQILGALQPTPTIATGYAIYPFVGMLGAGQRWSPSEQEVAAVLEFPLSAVRTGYSRRRLMRRGLPIRTDTYLIDEHLIWGATARIVGDLLERLDLLHPVHEAGGQRATG